MPSSIAYSEDGVKPCLYLHDLKISQVKGFSLGDEVTVVVKGKVKSVRQDIERKYEEGEPTGERAIVAELDVEFNGADLSVTHAVKNEFTNMAEKEEADEY